MRSSSFASGRLDGKVCLITGAGSGNGGASAKLFAREGSRVIAPDIDEESARRTVAAIEQSGGQARADRGDVTDEGHTVALAQRSVDRYGRIDVLFNNAGIAGVGDVVETEPELFDKVMKVNVCGVFLMSGAVVPHDQAALGLHHQHVVLHRGGRARPTRLLRRFKGSCARDARSVTGVSPLSLL